MSTLQSAKLYGRVALLRRQVLVQQFVRRAIVGTLAVAAFIVAAGLATYALFLAIRVPLGDVGATLTIAGIYLVLALVLLAYTLHEPRALQEMEEAALETVAADTQGLVQLVNSAGHRIDDIGSGLTLGVGILSALRKLLASRKS